MSIARQLYQLQEADLELDSAELAFRQITHQLGESEVLTGARSKLAAERQHLEELKKSQRAIEHDIDDLTAKLTKAEGELYSGRIRNPKELSNLQHEVDIMKAERSQLESRELEIMEQIDEVSRSFSFAEKEFQAVEAGWQRQQQELSANLERSKAVLAEITARRRQLAAGIEPSTLNTYQEVKRARGKAVVRVEQGICGGCRIALPVTDLQRCRSGNMVRCGSCGRILYLA